MRATQSLARSSSPPSLEPRATDVFEAQGLPQMQSTLVVFKRDKRGRITGLAIAPDGLHELPFRKGDAN